MEGRPDAIAILVFKISIAFIFAVMFIYFLKPVIIIMGNAVCAGCDPITTVLVTVVMPISTAFIGIYAIVQVFTAKIGG